MANLLSVGERIPAFTLPLGDTNDTILSSDLIRDRRVVFLIPNNGKVAEEWLRAASDQTAALNEREMTVVVISPDPESLMGFSAHPSPAFQFLRDGYRQEEARLGGAPAFYLVGKDGTVKRAEREFPPLEKLFQQIDSMPMRQQEMRED